MLLPMLLPMLLLLLLLISDQSEVLRRHNSALWTKAH